MDSQSGLALHHLRFGFGICKIKTETGSVTGPRIRANVRNRGTRKTFFLYMPTFVPMMVLRRLVTSPPAASPQNGLKQYYYYVHSRCHCRFAIYFLVLSLPQCTSPLIVRRLPSPQSTFSLRYVIDFPVLSLPSPQCISLLRYASFAVFLSHCLRLATPNVTVQAFPSSFHHIQQSCTIPSSQANHTSQRFDRLFLLALPSPSNFCANRLPDLHLAVPTPPSLPSRGSCQIS